MPSPEIDFSRIRPLDGSRHTGFEELCAQLASIDERPAKASFVRKGRGGDGGVECFTRLVNGDETGWQAKYVFDWNAGLTAQLNKSVRAALLKHPQMTKLIVCLPFDLPDSRPVRGKSARQKWDTWRKGWEDRIMAGGRALEIGLWDRSELSLRLTSSGAANAGRLFYWFGTHVLTPAWFQARFDRSRAALGSRYTPDTNVELPIRKDFLAFARDPSLETTVSEWADSILDKGTDAVRSLERLRKGARKVAAITALAKALDRLNAAFDRGPVAPEERFPLRAWGEAVLACRIASGEALSWTYALPPPKSKHGGSTDQDWARHSLFRFGDLLNDIEIALNSDGWKLANAHAALLQGAAGTGKSHLLADVVEHQMHAGRPALLILGSALVEDEPWRQIMSQLDLPADLQAEQFLGGLDAAAQAAGVRALICIDAINERHGVDIWPERLAAFLKTAEPFPRVSIVLSCRLTYVQHVVSDSIAADDLIRVTHQGFADRGGSAASVYLSRRGIVRPGAPNLVPEFQNPLFLKTCCDYLDRERKKELPRGLRGVSAIFGFYNEAVCRAVTRRMKLDPNLNLVRQALEGLSDVFAVRGEGYVTKADAIAVFEAILPSNGSLERSLLAQLESEGVLSLELVPDDYGALVEMVRFTFERFSDHAIAARLLAQYLDLRDVPSSFRTGEPLGDLAFGERSYRHAGVIEAIAIQLPERVGVELTDVRPDANWIVERAFIDSLLWREQSFFTERTLQLLNKLCDKDEVTDILISVSTEPANKFNAAHLHERLSARSLADRDASWSTYLWRRGDEDDPVGVLIDWASQNGMSEIDQERASLSAIVLGWCLATSNRQVRDRATKALACIFATRLDLAASTLRLFADSNDLYVRERLFAAAYGGALQGKSEEGLQELAIATFKLVFEEESAPLNELLRDHARGIINYAALRGHLPKTIDPNVAVPPHISPWPIELVSDEVIESYKQNYNGSLFGDAIVSSTINDGDFARYVVDHKIDRWTPASIGAATCPTYSEVAWEWIEEFAAQASRDQFAKFETLIEAGRVLKDDSGYNDSPARIAFKQAEAAFREQLSPEDWESFRVTALGFVEQGMFASYSADRTARFNRGWARRWICKRAHEFGWTAAQFAEVERGLSYDRNGHRIERIGKKYQWLALNELVSRMADNLLFMGDSYGDERRPYRSARDIGLRDIDPSLLIRQTYYDGWKQWPKTWWVPVEPRLREISPMERLVWLDSDDDLLNDASLIEVTNPKSGRKWLTLDSFASWRQSGRDGEHRELQRETWFRTTCIVVAKADEEKAALGLSGRILTDPHALPEFNLDSSFYLGEFPWHPDIEFDEWMEPDQWNQITVRCKGTSAEYLCERSGYDYSVTESIRISLPAPWLAHAMGLRLQDGQKPLFVDAEGETRFFDPSILEPGPQGCLIDRDAFLAMLDNEGLAPIWVIAGEKGVFGGRRHMSGFGGRLLHTGVYRLQDGGLRRDMYREHEKPVLEQLEGLLGHKPSRAIASRYAKSAGNPKRDALTPRAAAPQ